MIHFFAILSSLSKLMNCLVLDSGDIALVLVSVKIEPFTAISNIDDQIISVSLNSLTEIVKFKIKYSGGVSYHKM